MAVSFYPSSLFKLAPLQTQETCVLFAGSKKVQASKADSVELSTHTPKKVVYAGSFDPPTNGHLWMIEEGAKLFDEVIVMMAVNPNKRYNFSDAERQRMLKEMTSDLPNVSIGKLSAKQFLVRKAKQFGAVGLLRGLRNATDFEEESFLNNTNREVEPDIQTVFFQTPKRLAEVSSSQVRAITNLTGWRDVVVNMVPPVVFHQLKVDVLEKRFNALSTELGLPEDKVSKLFKEVLKQYDTPERAYHNLDHLLNVLEEFDTAMEDHPELAPKHPALFEYALWMHDLVDDRTDPDAIKKSVNLALSGLMSSRGGSSFNKTYVADMILATDHVGSKMTDDDKKAMFSFLYLYDRPSHMLEASQRDAKLIADIDLSILGKDSVTYKTYAQGIVDEYKELVSKPDFLSGRLAVLKTLLEKETLYQTEVFKEQYQKQAEKNLKAESRRLSRALDKINS